jgi:hypothetical protein
MPILHVEIVTRPDETFPADLAAQLADRTGTLFGSAPGRNWVSLQFTPGGQYAENGCPAGEPFPVFVSVLKKELPAREALQAEVAQLTPLVAQLCQRPAEHVHILYLPPAAGRVAFGGTLLPD